MLPHIKTPILQNGRLSADFEAVLANEFDLWPLWKQTDAAVFLAEYGDLFRGLVTSAGIGANADLINALPSLEVIASRGVIAYLSYALCARANGLFLVPLKTSINSGFLAHLS